MKRAKQKTAAKKPVGRPPKVGAKPYSVKLTDDVVAYYRAIGDENLTLGIERVARSGSRGRGT